MHKRGWIILSAAAVVVALVVVAVALGLPSGAWCMSRVWPGHSVSFDDALDLCASFARR